MARTLAALARAILVAARVLLAPLVVEARVGEDAPLTGAA
jgi:hypothetical protein